MAGEGEEKWPFATPLPFSTPTLLSFSTPTLFFPTLCVRGYVSRLYFNHIAVVKQAGLTHYRLSFASLVAVFSILLHTLIFGLLGFYKNDKRCVLSRIFEMVQEGPISLFYRGRKRPKEEDVP